MSGFHHSEISGSKVAHTSPKLIAACHVLHRLCMPRHPPIALTSRLRNPHHQQEQWNSTCWSCRASCIPGPCKPQANARRSARQKASATAQLDNLVCPARPLTRPGKSPRKQEAENRTRHRFLEPIHNVKEDATSRPHPQAQSPRNWFIFILGENGGAYRDRTDDLKLAKLALSQLS